MLKEHVNQIHLLATMHEDLCIHLFQEAYLLHFQSVKRLQSEPTDLLALVEDEVEWSDSFHM